MTTDRPPYIAEQFDDQEQQWHADNMGMWLFLATELLLFGGIFMAFAVYRVLYADAFAEAATHLGLLLGSINTAILMVSGLTMALAERAVGAERRRLTLGLLGGTLVLGLVFLAIKGYEYSKEFHEGLIPLPGVEFTYDGAHPALAEMFFNFYFVMTGLHALHMAIGLGIIAIMLAIGWRWRQPDRYARQVKIAGLYWAFVDIVWVFVFTSLYLLRA